MEAGGTTSFSERAHSLIKIPSESDMSSNSWTESMETDFRRLVRSEDGRKMLSEEVQVLTDRAARRGQRRSHRGEPLDRRVVVSSRISRVFKQGLLKMDYVRSINVKEKTRKN